jgi:hypothetical protein
MRCVNWVGLEEGGWAVGMLAIVSTGIGASRGRVRDQFAANLLEGLPKIILIWLYIR